MCLVQVDPMFYLCPMFFAMFAMASGDLYEVKRNCLGVVGVHG